MFHIWSIWEDNGHQPINQPFYDDLFVGNIMGYHERYHKKMEFTNKLKI